MKEQTTIYVPKICYSVREDNGGICDVVFQGFCNEQDAKDLYPEEEIIKMEVPLEKMR